MTRIDDGDPAFPVPWEQRANGMSLRDWFAGQALAGVMATEPPNTRHAFDADAVAVRAYFLADAMLAARKQDAP